jgi:hypothetical protein
MFCFTSDQLPRGRQQEFSRQFSAAVVQEESARGRQQRRRLPAAVQGSMLQNSASAENFSDNFFTHKFWTNSNQKQHF